MLDYAHLNTPRKLAESFHVEGVMIDKQMRATDVNLDCSYKFGLEYLQYLHFHNYKFKAISLSMKSIRVKIKPIAAQTQTQTQ